MVTVIRKQKEFTSEIKCLKIDYKIIILICTYVPTKFGMPQGSNLSSLLFTIHIND